MVYGFYGYSFLCLVGCFSMIIWTPTVLSVLYACVSYFRSCACSAQLSMFHMERRSRHTLIIIIMYFVEISLLSFKINFVCRLQRRQACILSKSVEFVKINSVCMPLLFKGSDLGGSAGQGFHTARLAIPGIVCALPTSTQPSQARIAFHLDCYCSVLHKRWVRAWEWAKVRRCVQQPVWKNSTSSFSSDYNQLVITIA